MLMPKIIRRALLLTPCAAMAQPQPPPLRVIESSPHPEAVMPANAQEFFIRFNAPVNHNQSRLIILREAQEFRVLMPRLRTAPEVLYAQIGSLPPGAYTLRWIARAGQDSAAQEGVITFTVR